MSWPELAKSVKGFDLSQYNNWANSLTNREQGRIDFGQLRARNPDVELAVIRACATSYIDADWEYNWAGAEGNFQRIAYVNNDPTWAVNGAQGEMWKRALGDKDHQVLIYDCESAFGRSLGVVTQDIQEGLDFLRTNFPNAHVIIYTAEWFWRARVEHGWEADEEVWTAHYIYVTQDASGKWRTAVSYAELDPLLPIHNGFTPRLPTGFKQENQVGWQATSSGIIAPIARPSLLPRTDLNYFLQTWVDEHLDGEVDPPPDTGPAEVTITFVEGEIDLTVIEE